MKSLIIIHGALGSNAQFDDLAKLLASSWDVHNLNIPGHGGKECSIEFSIPEFCNFLVNYIIEKELKQPMIFGFSLGGYLALYAESKHNGLFSKIVTLGTKFDWNPELASKEIKMLNPEKIAQKVPAFANRLKELHTPCDWREVVSKTGRMMQKLADYDALTTVNLSTVTCDVVVCRGSLDIMVTELETNWATQHLKNSQHIEIEGVQHPIDAVDVKIIRELLERFFY